MAHFTNVDLDNAFLAGEGRFILRMLGLMHKKYPHITDKIAYRVRPATQNDFYFTPAFADHAFIVDTVITKKLCEFIRCNAIKKDGPCRVDEVTSNYWVGEGAQIDQQCQPACFNMKEEVSKNEDNTPQVQSFDVRFNEDFQRCFFVPASEMWMTHPLYRANEKFINRLNNFDVGFDPKIDPNSLSQRYYDYNAYYCKSFNDQWDNITKECKPSFLVWLFGAVIGTELVRTGISFAKGNALSLPPADLPPVPPIDEHFLLDNWLNDIDPNFILPPTDFKLSDTEEPPSQNWRPEYEKVVRETEQLKRKITKDFKKNKSEKINNKPKELNNVSKKAFQTDEQYLADLITDTTKGILESIMTEEFWKIMGVNAGFEIILFQISVVFRKMADDYIPRILQFVSQRGIMMYSRVFQAAFASQIVRSTMVMALRQLSSMLIALARISAQISSVIGIILIVATFIDMILMFWDPLGFTNKYDRDILRDITFQSEQALRRDMGTNLPALNVNILASLLLTDDEILEISFMSFLDTVEYLNTLEVNSEGSRIDKGELISTDSANNSINESVIQSKLWTPQEFVNYQQSHTDRMNYFKDGKVIATFLFVSGVIFMLLQVYILAIVCFLVGVLFVFSLQINSVWNIGHYWEGLKNTINTYIRKDHTNWNN